MRDKKGRFLCGEKHPNWKGGVTPEDKKIKNSKEFKLWRTVVFERDNYTCIWCGYKSNHSKPQDIFADHIKPFALFPELRFAIDNGRTLCLGCHKTTDTYGVHKHTEEMIRRLIEMNHSRKGRKLSEELKIKISKGNIGKHGKL